MQFRNYRVLKEAELQLSGFTLVVGPNGSGKSTALKAFRSLGVPNGVPFPKIASAGLSDEVTAPEVVLRATFGDPFDGLFVATRWSRSGSITGPRVEWPSKAVDSETKRTAIRALEGAVVYAFDPDVIARPVQLKPEMTMQANGEGLAGVLDQLRDRQPERFEELNSELSRWVPEFDRILFQTPTPGTRSILLRTREGQHGISALDLSQGTLLALAILTLGYVPNSPDLVCVEEPDRGIHPRLLRQVRDAFYSLCYPRNPQDRAPVQVIATTHSPYLLDLFRDHPEEVVLAQKAGITSTFERLSDRSDVDDILKGVTLGDAWYSGVLGGVPAER